MAYVAPDEWAKQAVTVKDLRGDKGGSKGVTVPLADIANIDCYFESKSGSGESKGGGGALPPSPPAAAANADVDFGLVVKEARAAGIQNDDEALVAFAVGYAGGAAARTRE